MRLWLITSPTYSYTEWVCAEGGPSYDVADFIAIEAPTRHDAKVRAVRAMTMDRTCEWVRDQRGDGLCPFAGLRIEAVTDPEELREWRRQVPMPKEG
jgi:hypothetical protein